MPDARPLAYLEARVLFAPRGTDAVLIDGGTIAAVGPESEVRRSAPAGTEFERLGGRWILPGLIDPHLHWLAATLGRAGVDLRGVRGPEEIGRAVAAASDRTPGGPLLGGGWDQERFSRVEYPTRAALDGIGPDRPVALYRVCHHVALVNGAALDRLGIGRSTPDPPGGRIGRGPDGAPNGLLFDAALRALRPLEEESFRSCAAEATDWLARLVGRGLTTVGVLSALPAEVDAARAIPSHRTVPRLRLYPGWSVADGLRSEAVPPGEPAVGISGLKIVLDGSLGARTAALSEPYADRPDEAGLLVSSEEEIESAAQAAEAHGWALAMHAIGDRAVARALDWGERLAGRVPVRLEHASVVPDALLDRLARGRVPTVVQPGFVRSDRWIPERLGPVRRRWAYRFREMVDRGVPVAGSSDAPVEPADPWTGLHAAVAEAGLTPEEALAMYTHRAADALGRPALGRIAVDSQADLVVLDVADLGAAIARGGPLRAVVSGGRRVAPGAAI